MKEWLEKQCKDEESDFSELWTERSVSKVTQNLGGDWDQYSARLVLMRFRENNDFLPFRWLLTWLWRAGTRRRMACT